MAWLEAAAPYVQATSTALSAYSQYAQGKDRDRQSQQIASQYQEQAKRQQAVAQLEAQQERKKARLVKSRALAVAAASGAGASDPTVSDILTDIDTEGEMNALTTLANGDYLAQGLNLQANATRREGRAAKRMGKLGAATTAFSGAASWWDKYS